MPRGLRSLVVVLFTFGLLSAALAWQAAPLPSNSAEGRLPVLRAAGPRYWKGNLHTHSLWSDGDDFPEMIADWYRRHNYQFLALSDHNVLAEGERWIDVPEKGTRPLALKKYRDRFGEDWVERRQEKGKAQVRLKPLAEFRALLEEPGRFLLVPAEEITHRFGKAPVHLNAINLRDVIKPIDGAGVSETIQVNHRAVAEQRKKTGRCTLTSLNHPNFGWGVRAEDMAAVEELRFFEVFNGHPGVRNYGDDVHAGCERIWDVVLALRLGRLRLGVVYALATDDAHGYHSFGVGKVNPGRGWVMVRAPYLSAEAVVRAMDAGDFYASTGVELADVRRDGDRLEVTIRGEPSVTYRTQFIATLRDAPLTSEPRLGADGKPLNVTRAYSEEVGKVVSESAGTTASYRLTGKELYVRAKVVSSKPHPNPFRKGDVEVAWTQPVVP
jgi:hypothetical protein